VNGLPVSISTMPGKIKPRAGPRTTPAPEFFRLSFPAADGIIYKNYIIFI